jgi:hypothetical protein
MSMQDMSLDELKALAKWATDHEQKKNALKELSRRGENAIPMLEEILNVTAYDNIRSACADAIKAAKQNSSINAKK